MLKNVSIIIPAYNCEKYIVRCLNTLKEQTNKNFEVIIINDGSTDNTQNECEKFALKNNEMEIKIINQENKGVSAARNIGLDNANSEWITFIDSDDMVSKKYVEELLKNSKNSDFVVGNFCEWNENCQKNNSIFDITTRKEDLIINLLNEKRAKKLTENAVKSMRNVWGKLYKLELINKNKIRFNENLKYFEDGLFNLYYLDNIKVFKMTKEIIYCYYTDALNSATNKMHLNVLSENKEKMYLTHELIKKYNNKEIDIAYDLFKFDLLLSYMKNSLYHKNNKKSFFEKNRELIEVLCDKENNIYYNNIDTRYLIGKKKILYFLIKYKCSFIISFIMISQR